MPFVKLAQLVIVSNLKQKKDTKKSMNPYDTKATTIQGFKKIWGGGDFLIHQKYSDSLNITFLALFYGVGMPIMFPLAAIILFNQRFCEKTIVAYYRRMPPSMDDMLTKQVFSILKYAPILFLFNTFWLLDNRLMFSNTWSYKMTENSYVVSNHFFNFTVCQSTPLLWIAIVATIVSCMNSFAPIKLLKLIDGAK